MKVQGWYKAGLCPGWLDCCRGLPTLAQAVSALCVPLWGVLTAGQGCPGTVCLGWDYGLNAIQAERFSHPGWLRRPGRP